MGLSKRLLATTAAVGMVSALGLGSGTASAAWPNFSDCPLNASTGGTCIDIQSRDGGYLDIKGFSVPIGESINIRGGLGFESGRLVYTPPRGTNGLFTRNIQVPGGLLGINFPLPGNAVTAKAVLVGPSSNIRINLFNFGVSMPIKLKLSNPIIGPGCQIGSDSNPVVLNAITGTTAPPAPNRPISGRLASQTEGPGYITFRGNRNVDNSFAVPGASNCGINLGLINLLVNTKLRLPSAAGNNTIVIDNDVALYAPA